MENKQLQIVYQGQRIKIEDEKLCLTDFWEAVGRPKNKSAPQWLRLPQTINFIMQLEAKMGKSRAWIESRREEGTFAHWQVALAYAKYLSTDLEMHINEIYMRYRSGDVTLADQIAEKAGPEDQQWLLKRIASKVKRWLKIERLPANIVE